MVTLTRHGLKRTAKRTGVGKNGSLKLARRAMAEGIQREETTGNLRRYLDREYYSHPRKYILTYAGDVYIFTEKDGDLVTMFSLPGHLKHKKVKANGVSNRRKEALDMPTVLGGEPPCDGEGT